MDFDQIMDLRDKYRDAGPVTGVLRWFDAISGEGMVVLDDGQSLYCHFTAIYGVDKNDYQWPTESDRVALNKLAYNTPVMVTPYITCGYIGCKTVVILAQVEGA
jgi:cold shock CspA family protein